MRIGFGIGVTYFARKHGRCGNGLGLSDRGQVADSSISFPNFRLNRFRELFPRDVRAGWTHILVLYKSTHSGLILESTLVLLFQPFHNLRKWYLSSNSEKSHRITSEDICYTKTGRHASFIDQNRLAKELTTMICAVRHAP